MAQMDRIDESQRLDTLDARGDWVYPSAAESGHVEIELPALPGSPNATERLHARDFGPTVVSRIETSMTRQGYLKSGPQQTPSQVFGHYVAVARGSQLMDPAAIGRMEALAKEFAAEPDQREYFEQVLRPYLHSLTPHRR